VRCTKCRGQDACLEIRRHNAAYCEPCFIGFFRDQIVRAVEHDKMFRRDEPVLVAVSGGKDSLALWDALLDAGYDATGFYIGLGIPGYSEPSGEKCDVFAAARGARLIKVDLETEYGLGISETARRTMRPACSACGLSKRYLFNKVALDHGFGVIATGHNLDDEAATLFGNVLRWQTGYLGRQAPVLPEENGLVKKVKPLYRLAERETAAYAILRGIDYIVDECPNAVGAKSLLYKDLLNQLETASPGSKQAFLTGFFDKARPLFHEQEDVALHACERCGQPTTTPLCAFCRLREEVAQPRRRQGGGRRRRRNGGPGPGERAGGAAAVGRETVGVGTGPATAVGERLSIPLTVVDDGPLPVAPAAAVEDGSGDVAHGLENGAAADDGVPAVASATRPDGAESGAGGGAPSGEA
jgi:tRNA-5-methyluridine54 2-sulfurtransferase